MFKVLAVTPRVRIIQSLKHRFLCVGVLAKMLGITLAAVSQHLQMLKEAGLVKAEKRGYFMHYQLNHETISPWKEDLEGFFTLPAELEPCNFIKPGGKPCVTVKPNVRNRKS